MWHFTECAIQGRGHIKSGTPCQDKTMVLHKNNVFIITLADGAGSAQYSHFGAASIIEAVSSVLAERFDRYFSEENAHVVTSNIYKNYSDVLLELSNELNCKIQDLASTLLFVAVKDERFILGHIGDGIIGYVKNDQIKIASFPNNGEFSNETQFATSKNAHHYMNMIKGELNGITGFILMSDGTADSLYNKREKKLADVIKKIIKLSILLPKNKIDEILYKSFQKSVIQSTFDDCSMAVMSLNVANFNGFLQCNIEQKCGILNIINSNRDRNLRVQRYSALLEFMQQPRTLTELYQFIKDRNIKIRRIRKKDLDKHLKYLINLSLIELKNNYYHTLITL